MRHLNGFKQLGRTHSHRRALYRNMVEALFKNERIKTTKTKAKEIRRVAERIITKAKNKTLHNIRIIQRLIKDKVILMKLFNEISPRYIERPGGYTRVLKLQRRKGDGAEMAYLELIEEKTNVKKKKKKKIFANIKDKKVIDVDDKKDKKTKDVKEKNVKDENKEILKDTKSNSIETTKVDIKDVKTDKE